MQGEQKPHGNSTLCKC